MTHPATPLHPVLRSVTERILTRSTNSRQAYLKQIAAYAARSPGATRLGCANVAHAFAAMPEADKNKALGQGLAGIPVNSAHTPNIGVITAYNDMLSAHAPYGAYPTFLKKEAERLGVTLQVAGGVPAMCDGVTQGTSGMELSLFSRDTIALSTSIALSHDVFDAILLLGICDKIVPGLLIGALHFGHLPMIFVPSGPMSSGLSNQEKSKIRQKAAEGLVGRETLLAAEVQAYHSDGTCTFYGTANSNQMLLEAMGLHLPGSSFVHPHESLRLALNKEAVRLLAQTNQVPKIGELVNEHAIVNAMVALLATGGSTNHLIHWVAVARAAGIQINWDDFSELSHSVPLLARVYPNGNSDVNQFHQAGGTGFVIGELLKAGLMHSDALTISGPGLARQAATPRLDVQGKLVFEVANATPGDTTILRTYTDPFSPSGGLKLLTGNLGRSIIKISAVSENCHVITAPCVIFDSQAALQAAFAAKELHRDVICVVRWQGPSANGMPELHKLTPPLAILQELGFKVALITDGRMSGASGKVPAAIHVSPEAKIGGPLAKLRDGDIICLDADKGTLNALVEYSIWNERETLPMPEQLAEENSKGMGRELFTSMRCHVLSAEEGACTWIAKDAS